MLKVLIDTSTYLDLVRAARHVRASWAVNSTTNTLAYLREHAKLTISGCTVFEVVDGLRRSGEPNAIRQFLDIHLPRLEVVQVDTPVMILGGELNADLALAGKTIGVMDCMIAASAIHYGLGLVTSNTIHFQRVADLGYSLSIQNWRENPA